MGNRKGKEFKSDAVKEAFVRQSGYCASCGVRIWKMGKDGALWHKFGEHAEAHHVRPVKAGGTAKSENCVILCRACHMSAHQGGLWSDVSIYQIAIRDGKPIYASVETIAAEYPFYKFSEAVADELARINDEAG